MESSIKRLLMVGTMACVMPLAAIAQSGTDLYKQGMAKYNNRQYNAAIKLFQQSMDIDGSKKNKTACDAMIEKCRDAMKSKPTPSPTVKSHYSKDYSDAGRIADYTRMTIVDAVQDKSRVTDKVLPEILDDNFEIKKKEKYDWLHLSKAAGKVIIRCDDNLSTSTRWGTYYVTYKGKTEEFQVEQNGKPDGKIVSGDTSSKLPTVTYTVTIQRKEDFLVLSGLGSGTPVIKDMSPWIKRLDYKFKEKKKFLGIPVGKKDIDALKPGEAAFMVELFKGDEPVREGFIDIEGVGRYKIIQASSK